MSLYVILIRSNKPKDLKIKKNSKFAASYTILTILFLEDFLHIKHLCFENGIN